jgi:hypothetical protein
MTFLLSGYSRKRTNKCVDKRHCDTKARPGAREKERGGRENRRLKGGGEAKKVSIQRFSTRNSADPGRQSLVSAVQYGQEGPARRAQILILGLGFKGTEESGPAVPKGAELGRSDGKPGRKGFGE